MNKEFRPGTVVHPYERLQADEVAHLHRASLVIYHPQKLSIETDAGFWQKLMEN